MSGLKFQLVESARVTDLYNSGRRKPERDSLCCSPATNEICRKSSLCRGNSITDGQEGLIARKYDKADGKRFVETLENLCEPLSGNGIAGRGMNAEIAGGTRRVLKIPITLVVCGVFVVHFVSVYLFLFFYNLSTFRWKRNKFNMI